MTAPTLALLAMQFGQPLADPPVITRVRVESYLMGELYSVYEAPLRQSTITIDEDGETLHTYEAEDGAIVYHALWSSYAADINNDGKVDSTDMAMLLAAWGPVP